MLSNEWFSIMTTTKCSICGTWSVPAETAGFGSDPAALNAVGAFVVLDPGMLEVEVRERVVPVADLPLHPASRIDAPASPPPSSCRRLTLAPSRSPEAEWGVMLPTIDEDHATDTAWRGPCARSVSSYIFVVWPLSMRRASEIGRM